MDKEFLIFLIKMYTVLLNKINSLLEEYSCLAGEKEYEQLYSMGNDVSQKLDILKYELQYA
jgi:hypothetical protein